MDIGRFLKGVVSALQKAVNPIPQAANTLARQVSPQQIQSGLANVGRAIAPVAASIAGPSPVAQFLAQARMAQQPLRQPSPMLFNPSPDRQYNANMYLNYTPYGPQLSTPRVQTSPYSGFGPTTTQSNLPGTVVNPEQFINFYGPRIGLPRYNRPQTPPYGPNM